MVALAEWLRRVPAKYMGFPRESSNLSGVVSFFLLSLSLSLFFAAFSLSLHAKRNTLITTNPGKMLYPSSAKWDVFILLLWEIFFYPCQKEPRIGHTHNKPNQEKCCIHHLENGMDLPFYLGDFFFLYHWNFTHTWHVDPLYATAGPTFHWDLNDMQEISEISISTGENNCNIFFSCEHSTKLVITGITDYLFYCKAVKQQTKQPRAPALKYTHRIGIHSFNNLQTISGEKCASSCRMNWLMWYQHKGTPSAGSHTKECLRWSMFLWAYGGSWQVPSVGWGTELTAQTEHAF